MAVILSDLDVQLPLVPAGRALEDAAWVRQPVNIPSFRYLTTFDAYMHRHKSFLLLSTLITRHAHPPSTSATSFANKF